MKDKHKEISKGGTDVAKVSAKVSSPGSGDCGNSPDLGLCNIQRYKTLPTSNSSSSLSKECIKLVDNKNKLL